MPAPLMLLDGKACDLSACNRSFVQTKHPRSAVALMKDGTVFLIAVAGRFEGKAEGINIPELTHLLRVLGARKALNLDGGGSTTLWSASAPDRQSISDWGTLFFTSICWSRGRPNAAVLPVPVCARATTSLFSPKRYGITSSCTGMGFSYPISSIALRISGETPSSSNVFIKSLYIFYFGRKDREK